MFRLFFTDETFRLRHMDDPQSRRQTLTSLSHAVSALHSLYPVVRLPTGLVTNSSMRGVLKDVSLQQYSSQHNRRMETGSSATSDILLSTYKNIRFKKLIRYRLKLAGISN